MGPEVKKRKRKDHPGTRVVLIAIPNYSNDVGYILKGLNGRRH